MSKLKAKAPSQVEPTKPKVLIYGPPGVGKSWFSLSFKKVFYIDSEQGVSRTHYMDRLAKGGGVILGPEDGSLDPETIISQLQALATEKHGYETLVIDSATKIFNTIIAAESERLGDKDQFGASKKPGIAFMRRFINWIHRLDMNVIIITHEKEEWGQDAKGNRVAIGFTFDCFDKLAYELDLTFRVVKQGSSRYGVIRKSRLLGFPENERFQLDYETFASMYGKDVIEKSVTTITLATPEQVAEIVRLSDLLKMSEEEKQKWLTKASASDWSELTTEQASKAIAALLAKITPTK